VYVSISSATNITKKYNSNQYILEPIEYSNIRDKYIIPIYKMIEEIEILYGLIISICEK
jgi:hypothetical protein